jgi:hypothetical protein
MDSNNPSFLQSDEEDAIEVQKSPSIFSHVGKLGEGFKQDNRLPSNQPLLKVSQFSQNSKKGQFVKPTGIITKSTHPMVSVQTEEDLIGNGLPSKQRSEKQVPEEFESTESLHIGAPSLGASKSQPPASPG